MYITIFPKSRIHDLTISSLNELTESTTTNQSDRDGRLFIIKMRVFGELEYLKILNYERSLGLVRAGPTRPVHMSDTDTLNVLDYQLESEG